MEAQPVAGPAWPILWKSNGTLVGGCAVSLVVYAARAERRSKIRSLRDSENPRRCRGVSLGEADLRESARSVSLGEFAGHFVLWAAVCPFPIAIPHLFKTAKAAKVGGSRHFFRAIHVEIFTYGKIPLSRLDQQVHDAGTCPGRVRGGLHSCSGCFWHGAGHPECWVFTHAAGSVQPQIARGHAENGLPVLP